MPVREVNWLIEPNTGTLREPSYWTKRRHALRTVLLDYKGCLKIQTALKLSFDNFNSYINFVPQLLQNFAPFVGVPQFGQNFAPAKDAPCAF